MWALAKVWLKESWWGERTGTEWGPRWESLLGQVKGKAWGPQ